MACTHFRYVNFTIIFMVLILIRNVINGLFLTRTDLSQSQVVCSYISLLANASSGICYIRPPSTEICSERWNMIFPSHPLKLNFLSNCQSVRLLFWVTQAGTPVESTLFKGFPRGSDWSIWLRKIFPAVLCPTNLFQWKLICTFNQHSLSYKISNRLQFNSSLFFWKLSETVLHSHNLFPRWAAHSKDI